MVHFVEVSCLISASMHSMHGIVLVTCEGSVSCGTRLMVVGVAAFYSRHLMDMDLSTAGFGPTAGRFGRTQVVRKARNFIWYTDGANSGDELICDVPRHSYACACPVSKRWLWHAFPLQCDPASTVLVKSYYIVLFGYSFQKTVIILKALS